MVKIMHIYGSEMNDGVVNEIELFLKDNPNGNISLGSDSTEIQIALVGAGLKDITKIYSIGKLQKNTFEIENIVEEIDPEYGDNGFFKALDTLNRNILKNSDRVVIQKSCKGFKDLLMKANIHGIDIRIA